MFPGYSFGALGTAVGEIVFNTGMTGYQEVITDPSLDRHHNSYDCSVQVSLEQLTLASLPARVNKTKSINQGSVVRAIPAPNSASKPRSFFDDINNWAKTEGAKGLGYIIFKLDNKKLVGTGPIAKFFSDNGINKIIVLCTKL